MISRSDFDLLPDGSAVECFTLQNSNGMLVRLLTIGAAIQSVQLPDASGKMVPVALGYHTAEKYLHTTTYAGAICGRVANRIGGAQFSHRGHTYQLSANEGRNQLHGGPGGFHQRLWAADMLENGVRFMLVSPDGDQGYPGNLQVIVTYTLSEENALSVEYVAVSDRDTLCNLTNHSYWNLAGYGVGDALSQKVQILSDFFTPTGKETLPTGEIAAVRGPFDLREGKVLSDGIQSDDSQILLAHGYDHNFVLRLFQPEHMNYAASLTDPVSGRRMEIYTTMPGIQFFSGKDTLVGHTGVALETQYFPDAMRHWWFPSVVLEQNTIWRSRTEYRFHFNRT